jgi:hypothetical protein
MKNVSNKKKKFNLIKLFLLKYQIFKNFTSIKTVNITVSYIKQALFVIYSYHRNNKKILFVGLSNNNIATVTKLKNSNHSFIPQVGWSKKSLEIEVPNLIVIYNSNLKDTTNIVYSATKKNVPVITLQDFNMKKLSSNQTHNVSGDYRNNKLKKFFVYLIYSIIKKNSL